MFECCCCGRSLKIINECIKLKADVNAKENRLNSSILHGAAVRDNEAVVKLLVESGADVSAVDNKGNTPLHIAAANGNYKVVKQLLSYKELDPSAKNNEGKTAQQYAKEFKKKNVETLLYNHVLTPQELDKMFKQGVSTPKPLASQVKKKKKNGKTKLSPVPVLQAQSLWRSDDKYTYPTIGIWWVNPTHRVLQWAEKIAKNPAELTILDEKEGKYRHIFPFEVDACINNLAHVVYNKEKNSLCRIYMGLSFI